MRGPLVNLAIPALGWPTPTTSARQPLARAAVSPSLSRSHHTPEISRMKTDHKNYDDWAVKHDPPPPDPVPDLIYQGSDAAWFAANPQEWTSVVSASTPIGSLLNFNYQGGDIMSGLTQGPQVVDREEATTAALNDLAGGEDGRRVPLQHRRDTRSGDRPNIRLHRHRLRRW